MNTISTIALAISGGFLFGALLSLRSFKDRAKHEAKLYYRNLYNQQMAELCTRYRQERVALIHRYEGFNAEIEKELKVLSDHVDGEPTALCPLVSNMDLMLDEETA